LKTTLTGTKHIIGRVENMWINDEDTKKQLKELVMELKDTAYDAEDLLDEIQFRNLGDGFFGSRDQGKCFPSLEELTVRENQSKLDEYTTEIKHFIDNLHDDEKQMITSVVPRTTTSFPIETQVFGRDEQLNHLLEQLMKSADGSGSSNSSISTLTIVGIGGVGKTTLAQQAYNHERVKDYFHHKVWVCVSDNFNVERLTKEIIESLTRNKCDLNNFDTLQVVVKEELTSKRFLLVLDDVWNEDSLKWERFCAPLRYGVPGSKILVTTRSEKIAEMVGNRIHLGGLDEASYWKLFKKCAFGSEDAGEFPQLEAIAKKIVGRLKGLPLAARTVGGLLKAEMNEEAWRIIAGNEIWQLPQNEEGVLPVLQLSYQCLPSHLKRCFVFCSMFPKDYPFNKRELSWLWMAEGYVAQDNNMTMEDTGSRYFLDLVNRSFFQEAPWGSMYVIHDLIHDLAQFISEGEFCRINDESKEIPNTTRHLSATLTDGTKLMELSCYDKLRTLMINSKNFWFGFRVESPLFIQFEKLKNIRVLKLHGCGLRELPETIGELIHLRYLDISYNCQICRLSESLCGLYNLRVLFLQGCELQSFPHGMSKLINLMHLNAADEIISKINNVGKLASLRGLSSFKVLKDQGHEVAQLGSLQQLHGPLRITNLENVESKQEASKANLNNKEYLDELVLEWTSGSSLDGNELVVSEEVLEGLQPHQALKRLTIRGYNGVRSPSWLQAQLLANLRTLRLINCKAWKDLSCIGQLPNLKNLYVEGMPAVKQISHELNESKCFPSLEELTFRDMPQWEEWSWADGRQLFPCLRKLQIERCPRLKRMPPLPTSVESLSLCEVGCPKLLSMTRDGDNDILLPPSIKELVLSDCGNLGKLLLGCLHNLTSLTRLEIGDCRCIESLPATSLLHLKRLEYLKIWKCGELRSKDELLLNEGNERVEGSSVTELCIDDTALFKLSLLRRILPSVRVLTISNFPRATMSDEEEQLLRSLTALRSLEFKDCKNLQSLPTELHALPSLRLLKIIRCPKIQVLPEKGLPTSLPAGKALGRDEELGLIFGLEKDEMRYFNCRKTNHVFSSCSTGRIRFHCQHSDHNLKDYPDHIKSIHFKLIFFSSLMTIFVSHFLRKVMLMSRVFVFYKKKPCTAMSSWILAGLGSFGSSCIESLIVKITNCLIERVSEDPGVADLHKLRNTLSETERIIGTVENRWIKDEGTKKRLKELLMKLKDTVYDADDLLDEIQFRVLKQQIEQQGAQGYEASNQSSSSSDLPSSKKRKISERVSRFFGREYDVIRVRKIQMKLDKYTTEIKHFIDKLDDDEKQMITSVVPRTTTSFPIETQVFGRDEQLNQLLEQLMKSADGSGSSNSSISTLTIVGIGGVGKTTLAQQAYNHERVKDYFHHKVWLCVSDNFNVERLTKEIIEYITEKKCDVSNLDKLQKVLKKKLTSKRFLLVLDDVWNEDSLKWKRFCAPLRHGEPGSKILVTTRSKKIADMVGNPFPLDVLDDASYWEFFKQCAFGSKYDGEYPQLETIAENIVYRLNGLPLAAITVGGLLKAQMNEKHWRNIAGSEIWQLQQDEEGVLPVLQLSYQCLPSHLKRCFVYCSLFPKDHQFNKWDLSQLWMAEGYVAQDNNMTMEDTGSRYFLDLVNRSFFQEAHWGSAYVMHDLIHDLAQFISEGEFCGIDDDEWKEIPNTTRHLSVTVIDETKLPEFYCYEKLRTLMINYKIHWYVDSSLFLQFERLKNIRVLILQRCDLRELPETIGGSIHLRYLDISHNFLFWRLPESLFGLYNLRVLNLLECGLQSLPYGMSKLINLMHLNAEDEIISEINDVGKLTSLRGLSSFKVLKDQGHEVAQLGSLKQLHGQLRITNLENVESKQEAGMAYLNNKQYLGALALEWTSDDGSSLDGNELVMLEEVFEGLQPHQALKSLTIRGYNGVRSPSWLQAQSLTNLGSLRLIKCKAWKDLSCIGQLPNLKNLYVEGMPAVKQISHELKLKIYSLEKVEMEDIPKCEGLPCLDQLPSLKVLRIERMPAVTKVGYGFFDSRDQHKYFPSLEELTFRDMPEWEEWSWADGRQLFPCLRILEIKRCPKLKMMPPLPPSLESLSLCEVGLTEVPRLWEEIDGSSSSGSCITASRSSLEINQCPNLRNLEEGLLSHSFPNIRDIAILECAELVLLPVKEFKELTSLEKLSIRSCPKLLSMTRDGDINICLPPSIKELVLSDCGNLVKLLLGCLHNLTSLTRLEIGDCPSIESLPETSLVHLKRLEYLKIWKCGELRSKDELLLNEGNKQVEGSSVSQLCIDDTALFKLSLLRRTLPSVRALKISNFPRATMSGEEEQLLRSLTALRSLEFLDCKNLQSLPIELHALPSLRLLAIFGCPEIQSLPEKGLPTSLRNLIFIGCHPMLSEQLKKHLDEMKSSGRFLAV
ncbi:unnamed protein product, partial [Musa banksii]